MTGRQSDRRLPRQAASSTLIVLAGLLCLAGATRLGMGVAAALAAGDNNIHADATAPEAPAADPADLFMTLRAREVRLEQAESRLAQREEALEQARAEIAAQMRALAEAEQRLLDTLSLTESAAEDDIARLIAVYEHMKPRQAAQMFSQMDVTFAAGFFARLRPDFAGAVMEEFDPGTAYAISAVLAGRNAAAPTR